MRPILRILILTIALAALAASCALAADPAAGLERGFTSPPDSAKPHTWWHWVNGNITKEGITLDLEAMKRVGVGGAQIFDVAPGDPAGKVDYGSPQWHAMIKHAVQEADRLGIELCMHNCAGWSSSGGPWIKPENAMQMVVTSEKRVAGPMALSAGPMALSATLAQPMTRLGFYRDIAVIAFPTPAAEAVSMRDLAPKVTSDAPGFDPTRAVDGDPNTTAVLTLRGRGTSRYIQFEFAQPFAARSLSLIPGGGRGGQGGDLQVSDDGVTFKRVVGFGIPEVETTRSPVTVSFAPVSGRFYRLVFTRSSARSGSVALAEVRLESSVRISNMPAKAGWVRGDSPSPDTGDVPGDATVERAKLVDLTQRMDATGKLTWDVPAGNWTILRFGYTPTGATCAPASESGRGLECDKLSAKAADAHFAGLLEKVIADLGPLAGKTLNNILIDSYEVGCDNWTPLFREEFSKRRGYDLLPYLPIMTGRVVGTLDESERFLWDLRRTLADLFAENYFGRMAELCHKHGLQLSVEPYGNGNFDCITAGSFGDIPMSEFWAGGGNDNQCSKLASSAAHVYGRQFVGAEAFTAGPGGGWLMHPYAMKALGDLIWCGGVNRFIFHRYAHQPWVDLKPGMTMGPYGFEFERTNTWWNESPAWLQYITRSQYLLQSGLFVADLCYLDSENAPSNLPSRGGLQPPPPPGYDYDGCDSKAVLTRMIVKDGRLVLPDGMSYRALVLPPSEVMTPTLLRKVRDLVRDGATVVGPKPSRSPSLSSYPDCDKEVQALAAELWGPCDGKTVTERSFGKGATVWGKPLAEVLAARKVKPDFEAAAPGKTPSVVYIHRVIGGADAYFVSNQEPRARAIDCTFRAVGRVPELWHPDTGLTEIAPIYREKDGRTTVTIAFQPAGSVFVLFRKAARRDPIVAVNRNGASVFLSKPRATPKVEIIKAVYGVFAVAEETGVVDVTAKVAALVRDGTLSVSASNELAGDPAGDIVKQMRVEYTYNDKPFTKTVDENAQIQLPDEASRGTGPEPGVLVIRKAVYGLLAEETAPPETPTVDVTAKLATMLKDGALSVVAGNDLAGDPAPLIVKQMRVEYMLDGKRYAKTLGENATLDIPDGTENEGEYAQTPPPDIAAASDGSVTLTAWQPGRYEATLASGKRLAVSVPSVPTPLAVAGPWEVSFPPKLGAPATATLPKLISWPESDEPGIRYFSGTATYTKDFDVPRALLRPGNAVVLDLGVVRELAEVRLNGKNLGVLWKPPFRVDITRLARPGANRLEVRVTNLWVNRLIGDEQLPDDAEWSGEALRGWPAWLVEGKPRPQTGRIAFAAWKHYSKDSALLDSGLLGPVTVQVGAVVRLAPR